MLSDKELILRFLNVYKELLNSYISVFKINNTNETDDTAIVDLSETQLSCLNDLIKRYNEQK